MIPVRGPTIFERQLQDFVHGTQSKSGAQSQAINKLKMKMKAKEEEEKKRKDQ